MHQMTNAVNPHLQLFLSTTQEQDKTGILMKLSEKRLGFAVVSAAREQLILDKLG